MTHKQMALDNLILRLEDGSALSGTEASDSSGDRDEMAVCIETPEYALSLKSVKAHPEFFDNYQYRTAAVRAGETGRCQATAKSEAGDLDLKIYSLRRFLFLAAGCNPSIVTIFFAPESSFLQITDVGREMLSLGQSLACKETVDRFKHYMRAQKYRLTGERGQKRTNRPELIEKYGYDTKYASQVIKLGFQGLELVQTGRITLPMPEAYRQTIVNIRDGRWEQGHVIAMADDLERTIDDRLVNSTLPEEVDQKPFDDFLVKAYLGWWSQTGQL